MKEISFAPAGRPARRYTDWAISACQTWKERWTELVKEVPENYVRLEP
jgi:hypothetical protein